MHVTIRLYTSLREKLGWRSKKVELDKDDLVLKDIFYSIEGLRDLIDKDFEINYIVLLNGVNIRLLNGLNTRVHSGDTIDIFPPSGGGT